MIYAICIGKRKENNVIVETDFVEFVIRAPYYGKPFVCN